MQQFVPERAHGMLLGVMLGDAIGAPFEFANDPTTCDGTITKIHQRTNRYAWTVKHELGQVTDDTEMACALMHVLVAGYTMESALVAYHKFANSGTHCIGRNTRALLNGYKSNVLAKYKYNAEQQFPDAEARHSAQSNGHLMRSAPIALIDDASVRRSVAVADTMITNPSPVCVQIVLIYTDLLAALIRTTSHANIDECIRNAISNVGTPLDPTVKDAIEDAKNPRFARNIRANSTVKNAGWSAHSFSVSLWALAFANSFEDGMVRIVQFGGDTDTNAAIGGALLGARFGGARMRRAEELTSKNISIVLGCDPKTTTGKVGNMKTTPRPPEYHPQTLLENLFLIDQSKFSVVHFQPWYDGIQAANPPKKRVAQKRPKRDVEGTVIAVSGASQSGKTTLCKALLEQFGKDRCKLLSQDSFRFERLPKRDVVDGKPSWEGAKFTDFEKLNDAIMSAKEEYEYVFVEGYTLLDNDATWNMADCVYWVESDEATGAHRRSKFPQPWENAANYYRGVVWPAHLMYRERVDGKVSGQTIPFTRLQCNSSVAERVWQVCNELSMPAVATPTDKGGRGKRRAPATDAVVPPAAIGSSDEED
jgi:ADP-ribosylglycohydrolase